MEGDRRIFLTHPEPGVQNAYGETVERTYLIANAKELWAVRRDRVSFSTFVVRQIGIEAITSSWQLVDAGQVFDIESIADMGRRWWQINAVSRSLAWTEPKLSGPPV